MTEKPIIFSGPMVRAILEGRKTQTRRVVKPQPAYGLDGFRGLAHNVRGAVWRSGLPTLDLCPKGISGTKMWVRETWGISGGGLVDPCLNFRADGSQSNLFSIKPGWWRRSQRAFGVVSSEDLVKIREGWRPSMFMPRWASRITLEITEVRVERLQEITEKDAESEGIVPEVTTQEDIEDLLISDARPEVKELASLMGPGQFGHRFEYEMLWDEINGKKYPWASNPFVWVISFRRVEAGA